MDEFLVRTEIFNISNLMGDRSPKSNQKKSAQKQAKVAGATQKKNQATASKQAAKLAAKKK